MPCWIVVAENSIARLQKMESLFIELLALPWSTTFERKQECYLFPGSFTYVCNIAYLVDSTTRVYHTSRVLRFSGYTRRLRALVTAIVYPQVPWVRTLKQPSTSMATLHLSTTKPRKAEVRILEKYVVFMASLMAKLGMFKPMNIVWIVVVSSHVRPFIARQQSRPPHGQGYQ